MTRTIDAIVVGAGQAGPAMAARCGREGLETVLIEAGEMGGTCVNNGCIPTKTLVASARAAHIAKRAKDFGVTVSGTIDVDMRRVKARKDAIVGASRKGVGDWMHAAKNVSVIRGHAKFVGPHDVEVNGQVLSAPRIFINVGGRPSTPGLTGIESVPYLDNIGMMELEELPEHLMVIGGSYIGLEFAQMYRRFGSEVTVCEMGPRLISREDEDVSDEVRAILEREGVKVQTGAQCLSVEKRGERIAVGLSCGPGTPQLEGSHLLVATGRRPNTDTLDLNAAGIQTDQRGYIIVNEQLESSVPGVWALGDVNGRGAFTHTSWNDYEIVAANLFDQGRRRVSDRIATYALFTDPPLGRCGMTLEQAQATGRPLLMAKMPMTRVGRAREAGETQGFMKVVVDAESKRILGATLLGLSADEVVQSILRIMYADLPYTAIQQAMPIHPTVSELLPTLLDGLKPVPA
ncbi:MAG: FAD-containing oxidoreductase [Betaproteobacteria bacterium]|nr:FAD-containing oxidoreductase [Betaproteobacteria bacterium]